MEPTGPLMDAIAKTFGSFADFKDKSSKLAIGTFGSGWAWLVRDPAGVLALISTSNAGTPLTSGQKAPPGLVMCGSMPITSITAMPAPKVWKISGIL